MNFVSFRPHKQKWFCLEAHSKTLSTFLNYTAVYFLNANFKKLTPLNSKAFTENPVNAYKWQAEYVQ